LLIQWAAAKAGQTVEDTRARRPAYWQKGGRREIREIGATKELYEDERADVFSLWRDLVKWLIVEW
jgi:hypothetical protein